MRLENPLARMRAALTHRGPDGEGTFVANHVALGMRRLSIIDIEDGWQPFHNEDRSLTLIANGEIYNSDDIRRQLVARGHRFRSRSDCEVIVHLYEEHGQNCVEHLRGMFAFALWDANARRLFLARDRMGEKPMYLYEQAGQLMFASELKGLLASGQVPFRLDPEHVNLYFYYQFVPEPKTPIVGVRKLPPGHFVMVDVDPWRVTERCYWRMEDAPPLEGDPAEILAAELEEVAHLVARADVPIGVALSGGLDSGAVAALLRSVTSQPLWAFTVGFAGHPTNDERSEASGLARALGMEFSEIELSPASAVEMFPTVVEASDDPIADMTAVCYYAVARHAREHGVRVLLQGQGGDELFWGYPWLREAMAASELKCRLWQCGQPVPLGLPPGYPDGVGPGGGSVPLVARMAGFQEWQDSCSAVGQLTFYDLNPDFLAAGDMMRQFYTDEFLAEVDPLGPFSLFTLLPPREHLAVDITRLACQTYLLENGLAQGDRLSMSSSVELRLPLVDHRLVEKIVGLRKTFPDHRQPPKAWLRGAVRNLLPQSVLSRPKRPFSPPLRNWHRYLFAAYRGLLPQGYLVELGVLRPDAASQLAQGWFPAGAGSTLAFKALVLELWCRINRNLGQDALSSTVRSGSCR